MGPRRMGGERIVLVHGFTQTARSWDRWRRSWPIGFEVVARRPAGPRTARPASARTFEEAAAAIGDAGGAATYVGYSLGGPPLPAAGPRPAGAGRAGWCCWAGRRDWRRRRSGPTRKAADDRLADDIERIGTEAFLDKWLSQPMFASLTPTADDLAARRANPPDGLAYALRRLGTGVQEPLWDRLGELAMPVLVVAGGLDAKFTALGRRMAAAIGDNASVRGHAGLRPRRPPGGPGAVLPRRWSAFLHAANRAQQRRIGHRPAHREHAVDGHAAGRRPRRRPAASAVPRPQA